MADFEELVGEAVRTAPLILLTVKSPKVYEICTKLLPYSTGFEIECSRLPEFKLSNFENIPGIMAVGCDGCEQRFRIPPGLPGIFCLYAISVQLKLNSALNEGSGIHYHVDMTDCCQSITQQNVDDNKYWMLRELETWNYKGTYNPKEIRLGKGGWAGFRLSKNTLEIRIGEMTFDYELLIQRILHAQEIVMRFRTNNGMGIWSNNPFKGKQINQSILFDYAEKYITNTATQRKLAELEAQYKTLMQKKVVTVISAEEIKEIVQSRIIKL